MVKYYAAIKSYDNTTVLEKERQSASKNNIEFVKYPCRTVWNYTEENEVIKGKLVFEMHESFLNPASVSFELDIENWKKENYILIPAAVYDGNRFSCMDVKYPPFFELNGEDGSKIATTITDVPRLSDTEMQSQIQLLSGDTATPAIGYFDHEKKQGLILLTTHGSSIGYYGLSVREDLEQSKVTFSITAPGVRENTKYLMTDTNAVSDDEGRIFEAGEQVEIPVHIYQFKAENLHEFYRKFFEVKFDLEKGGYSNVLPFSKAYHSVKEKYLRENFCPKEHFFGTSLTKSGEVLFQPGWVGGAISSYPILLGGEEGARESALESLHFIFEKLQNENGWIIPIYTGGKQYGDTLKYFEGIPETEADKNTLLVRKNSDLLYFVMKQLLVLKESGKNVEDLEARVEKLCDAYVRLWKKYGQFGQFIHIETEEIIIGNTASAAVASAALVNAYQYFGKQEYLEVAEAAGEYYYKEYLSAGLLNGGPGEILQCPDSESAFGLLESYVELYEYTHKKKWLDYAIDAFHQASTWIMSYDFVFPKESTDAKMKMHTIGTVFANVQNKHSAPGICTLSGNSMLKLYRFTGDVKYLEILKGVSHNLMQFVQTEERPIMTLDGKCYPSGYMGERVQTSDWEGKHAVGEIASGSSGWPEVCAMLTYMEVPGIYVDVKREVTMVFDHVECELNEGELKVKNPTQFDAEVTVMIDDMSQENLGTHYFNKMKRIQIPAYGQMKITL